VVCCALAGAAISIVARTSPRNVKIMALLFKVPSSSNYGAKVSTKGYKSRTPEGGNVKNKLLMAGLR
jgi:hypothetical protein